MTLAAATFVAAVGTACLFHEQLEKIAGRKNIAAEATSAPTSLTPAADAGFRAAVLQAFRETNPTRLAIAFGTAFANWFQHDPEAALAWLRQMPQGREYTQGLFIVLQEICKTDPQRALALAQDMAKTHEQKFVYSALFDQLTRMDLTNATAYLQFVPAGDGRDFALRALTDYWARKDSAAALNWAQNLEDAGERSTAMESVLLQQAATDPQQALELAAQNLDGGALNRVVEKSLSQLALTDPQQAADIASELPAGELQENSAINIARALAAQAPDAVVAWLQTLPADIQPTVLNNALDVWLKSDPAGAANFVAAMTAGSQQDAAISHFAEDWAETDSAAAIVWAENLTGSSAQSAAVISIASGWARTDAAAATQWAQNLPAENPARNEALRGAFSYWELADKTASENYLENLTPPDREILKPSTVAAK